MPAKRKFWDDFEHAKYKIQEMKGPTIHFGLNPPHTIIPHLKPIKSTSHILHLQLSRFKNTSEKVNNHRKRKETKIKHVFPILPEIPEIFSLRSLPPFHHTIYHAQRTSLGLMPAVLPSNSPWWKVGTVCRP